MDDSDFLAWAGTDASRWAEGFCKKYPSVLSQIEGDEGVIQDADLEGLMICWFANAIEAGALREARENEPITDQIAVIPAIRKTLEEMRDLRTGGPHVSAKAAATSAFEALDMVRMKARDALSLLDSGETVE